MNRITTSRIKQFFTIAGFVLILLTMIASGVMAAPDEVRLDLFIELRAPEHVEPGEQYTVNVSYGNSNTAMTPEDTWVEATLPAGVEFVSAMDKHNLLLPPDSIDGNILHWDVGRPLPDWETEHIYILLAVDEELPQNTSLTVSAEIGSSSDEVTFDNNIASVTSITCDMAGSTKQAKYYELMPLDIVDYTITIKLMQGTGQAYRDVTLVDYLPPGEQVRFLGWISQETGTFEGNTLRWQGRVHAGEPVQLQYRMGINGDVPPDTALTNRAHLSWWDNGELELEPVVVEVYLPDTAHVFAAEGGTWQYPSGVTLDLPQDAVAELTRFQVQPVYTESTPEDKPAGWFYTNLAFEMSAYRFEEIHQFNQSIGVTISYDQESLQGLDLSTLSLWYRSEPGTAWQQWSDPIVNLNEQISFETDHFSEFALFAKAAHQLHLPLVMGK